VIPNRHRAARIFGIIVGATVGIETLFPEAMCCGGTIAGIFFTFTLPGMLVSGIVVGNVHAYPLWIAVLANAALYFFLGSSLWRFAAFVANRLKRYSPN
jgi:hypothetical protein